MRLLQVSWLFPILMLLSFSISDNSCAQGQCLNDQRALLLQLNQSLIPCDPFFMSSSFSSKRSSWHLNTDCCASWKGVKCDRAGHVIGLDLSSENIGELNNSSSLFNLQYLERLNMAHNSFSMKPIPSGLDKLVNLHYLNLSTSDFSGQIPIDISRLTRLVTLDLSTSVGGDHMLLLRDPDLEMLTRNLTGLKKLLLDGVGISETGSKWCRTLSSSLPKLQVLSMSNCNLSGTLHKSLLLLGSLSKLRLERNNMSAEVPEFLSEFRNLASLSLSDCELHGKFPKKILQSKTLRSLDLSDNYDLQGSLPEFPTDGQLQELVIRSTRFTGGLPDSIANLRLLAKLDLYDCGFNGSIPISITKLSQLQLLDLSRNYFTGQLSDFFDGSIPTPVSMLNQLQFLDLSMNGFDGHLGEFFIGSSSPLEYLLLGNNHLQGDLPLSIFNFSKLRALELESNSFSGTIILDMLFRNLRNLSYLYLSDNRLSIDTTSANYAFYPQLTTLFLSSCNLTEFPSFLKNESQMETLDLSNNQIRGNIPNWIWKIGSNEKLWFLNLFHNFLEDPVRPVRVLESFPIVLDLHSNKLQGKNPILAATPDFLDYSFNNFTSIIPNISSHLSNSGFFSLSNNQISGEIPTSICELHNLRSLDFSHNNFSGPIPACLGPMSTGRLRDVNLRENNLQGIMPNTFPNTSHLEVFYLRGNQPRSLASCNLEKLDLNGNQLIGQLPRSLASCIKLKIFDVGNNQLTGTFPSQLGSMPQLRVLVLRSNRLYGPWGNKASQCNFPNLQIVDVSFNNFSGVLSKECFSTWKGMVNKKIELPEENPDDEVLGFKVDFNDVIYQETLTITIKGVDMEVVKILPSFTSIDFSSNQFEGDIPESIGNLTLLYTLNLSRNAFTGPIPSTIGNLTHLESLDFSQNKLIGKIPVQLADLSSLAVLNLSYNKLVGEIPFGRQIQTFNSSAFEGNDGLCGFPLTKNCTSIAESPTNVLGSDQDGFDWVLFAVTFLGFVVGASMVIGPQYFWKKGREWFNERINKMLNIT